MADFVIRIKINLPFSEGLSALELFLNKRLIDYVNGLLDQWIAQAIDCQLIKCDNTPRVSVYFQEK
jgi:hypothetical protein